MEHKLFAVYGNSGSYKTTTAVNLVTLLSRYYSDASVALVSVDDTKPILPLVLPHRDCSTSLGSLMGSIEELDETQMLVNAESVGSNIAVYGYNKGENINSYPMTADPKIDDFYMHLRNDYEFTVIDCTSSLMGSKYTAKAIIHADKVLQLISCDVFGLSFYDSQYALLQRAQYGYDRKFIKCLSLPGEYTPDTTEMKRITNSTCIIPHSKSATIAINSGQAFGAINDKVYRHALRSIIEILTDEAQLEPDNEELHINADTFRK